MQRFLKPLTALILGLLPFFLFIGSTGTLMVNGETVSDSRFNPGGIVLALIGIALAAAVIAEKSSGQMARKLLAGLAVLVCALQLASSADLLRIDPLDWVMPDRNLPAAEYSGLAEADRIYLVPETEENYRSTLAHRKAEIISSARLHNAYAAKCHGGRSRVDLARAEAMPDVFDAELQSAVADRVAQRKVEVPQDCSRRQSIGIMVALADETNRSMDMVDRLTEEFRSFIATSPTL
ncbi:hypothetical protein [Paracoccus sp. IB05]|uniref:hypothetical protein n=1 Tax=Paracoccus sp. IB05 TaxID=2779367 RepID=UPI0018E75109|nr:hypothetical protein [Paracoccus sp. IB05]MBJ2152163.1 hypothetical protein [Paracoccus sp. IB05]